MKNFRFDDIWIMSTREQRGLQLTFHPGRNLIVGKNHTGKSTIIKTLFTTLGAKPSGRLERWDHSAASAVRFTLEGKKYRAVCDSGRRALFGPDGALIHATSSGAEWSRIFAELAGFNLILTHRKDEEPQVADPGCYFLPFYIDQDTGWTPEWKTFKSTKQFKAPIVPIMEYFSGIKPPEFYSIKAVHDAEQAALSDLKREITFLKRAQDRFGTRLSESGPKIDPANFEAEVARLSAEISELNRHQEVLRKRAAEEGDLIATISRQIDAANAALSDHQRDAQYIRSLPSEPLVCPVCRAEHAESYLDLIVFADDARAVRVFAADLVDERQKMIDRLRKTQGDIGALESNYRRIEAILAVRRGDMEFREVVESRGAEKAFEAFEEERTSLETKVGEAEGRLRETQAKMKFWRNTQRQASIVAAFKNAYAAALYDLNMPPAQISGLAGRPELSGSGGPRAILAYHSALWTVCLGETGAFANPIVVDSPNQQGQDAVNLPLVLKYVSTELPTTGQLILGSELDVPHDFDNTIALDRAYQVLHEDAFEEARFEFGPMLDALYERTES